MDHGVNTSGTRGVAKRLVFAIVVVATLVTVLAVLSQTAMNRTTTSVQMVQGYADLQHRLASRGMEHEEWANALGVGALLLKEEVSGHQDASQCELGKWLAAFSPPTELADASRGLGRSHQRLHAAGAQVVAALQEGQADAAHRLYRQEVLPALAENRAALAKMRVGLSGLIDREIGELGGLQDRMGSLSWLSFLAMLATLLNALFLVRTLVQSLPHTAEALPASALGQAAGDLARTFNAGVAEPPVVAAWAAGGGPAGALAGQPVAVGSVPVRRDGQKAA
jgi:hypothetical protein